MRYTFIMFSWLSKLFKKQGPEIIMIAAIQNDRGIGYQKKLIHNIKDDMKHFVDRTTPYTIIMGRKNWETIPEKFRPLENRQNIVITRTPHYHALGALVAKNLQDAITQSTSEKIYIIGGGQIYSLGIEIADTLDLTQIDDTQAADVFFPEFENDFFLESSSEKNFDEKTGLHYQFQIWKRKKEH